MSIEAAEVALMTETIGRAPGSDDTLVDRASRGDRAAFSQIVIEHQRKVAGIAWRILGNEEDARDAAQESFFRAYKYLRSFKRGEDFGAWLYRIVVNVCRDAARKRRRRELMISLDTAVESGHIDALAGPQNLESDAILAEERRLVMMALDTLTTKEREALVLRDLEGLPTEEVAKILGSSPTTVRSQICSARAKIKIYRDKVVTTRRTS